MTIQTTRNGRARIAYEVFGPPGGRPLLLVTGLDTPMQWWPRGFCDALAARGFRVARFDLRDCGLSERYPASVRQSRIFDHRSLIRRGPADGPGAAAEGRAESAGRWPGSAGRLGRWANLRALRAFQLLPAAGRPHFLPQPGPADPFGLIQTTALPGPSPHREPDYVMRDMVDDAFAVMDALGWQRAHVVGASLGASLGLGMAVLRGERVRTLVTIMALAEGFGPAAAGRYLHPLGVLRFARLGAHEPRTRQEDIAAQVETARLLASPAHPFDEQWAVATAQACRALAPGDPGTARRQLAAMRADEGVLGRLGEIAAPTLILHGADDPLIKPASAITLARNVPGARSVVYSRMGHEVPEHLWPALADEIARHAAMDPTPDRAADRPRRAVRPTGPVRSTRPAAAAGAAGRPRLIRVLRSRGPIGLSDGPIGPIRPARSNRPAADAS